MSHPNPDAPWEIQPPAFTPVKDFTTFDAEYAFVDGDIVVHFFRTDEVKQRPDSNRYWHDVFGQKLSDVAMDHFKAGSTLLSAAFTEEMDSWWFRAKKYAKVSLDPDLLVTRFFEKLDQALETKKTK